MVNYSCYYLGLIFLDHHTSARETNSNKTGAFVRYLKMLIDPYLCWKNKPFNKKQLSVLHTRNLWHGAIDQFSRTDLYNPVSQKRSKVPWGCSKWCQVNTFLKELYVSWTLLCTIFTNSRVSVLWLVGVDLSENSLSFVSGKCLSSWTRHYAGSPGCGAQAS